MANWCTTNTINAADHDVRLARARLALDGLSLGDAYGERFFAGPAAILASEDDPPLVPAAREWKWTDDTAMALSIVEELVAGDMDTTAAIVGGVVALAVGRAGLPAEWLARREPLPG